MGSPSCRKRLVLSMDVLFSYLQGGWLYHRGSQPCLTQFQVVLEAEVLVGRDGGRFVLLEDAEAFGDVAGRFQLQAVRPLAAPQGGDVGIEDRLRRLAPLWQAGA